jgi:hypothetical protein
MKRDDILTNRIHTIMAIKSSSRSTLLPSTKGFALLIIADSSSSSGLKPSLASWACRKEKNTFK